MAAIHILEWRVHNPDIAPEAEFDGDAGGESEGATQAQTKPMYQCKKTEDMKDGTLKSVKLNSKMDELKEEEHTYGTSGLRTETDTCEESAGRWKCLK